MFTCPSQKSNPVARSPGKHSTPFAVKAGFYCKAVEVCHLPIPGDIQPLQFEIRH